MIKRFVFPLVCSSVSISLAGCGIVLGLDDYSRSGSSSTGEAGQGGAGGASSSSSSNSSSSTGGMAGAGGSGGAPMCTIGMAQGCYSGTQGTQGVGICKGGMQTCQDNGTYGPCNGETLPSTEDCAQKGDEDCNGSSCSETIWARIFGDNTNQTADVVTNDGMGGLFVAGTMDGTVKFDNDLLVTGGGKDIFLAHLAPDGTVLWAKRFGDAADQYPTAITVDAMGNVYLGAIVSGSVDFGGGTLPGPTSNDMAVASFKSDGTHRWSHRYGDGASQEVNGLAMAPSGDLIMVGSYGGSFAMGTTMLVSAGGWDFVVTKFDTSTGNPTVIKQFGDALDQKVADVAIDSSGGIILVGTYTGGTNFGGGALPTTGMNDMNAFVLKLDSGGTHVWSKGYGDSDPFQFMRNVAVAKDGSVVFTGEFESTISFGGTIFTSSTGARDIFLAKLSSTGQYLWSKSFGGNQDDWVTGLDLNANGDIFLSTHFVYSISFGGPTFNADGAYDLAVARLAPDGSHVWSRQYTENPPALKSQYSSDIAIGSDERALFVTGYQMGSVDYGTGTPLTTVGTMAYDAVVFAVGP